MRNAKGFSLIELMIVVAVIAILAAIGIPAYGNYVIRGKLVDATTQLSSGRVQLEQFFQDNRVYDNSTGGTPPCPNSTKYFTISCAETPTTYTITAASNVNTGLGTAAGAYTYTLDQNNTKVTVNFAGVAMNQVAPNQCWLMKQGDSC